MNYMQCCGSGFGAVLPLDPGWVKSQDPGPGSGMNSPDHVSENLGTILNSLMRIRIRDPESF
jgi:hypothetical protein